MGDTGETGEMGDTIKTCVTDGDREVGREGGTDRHRPDLEWPAPLMSCSLPHF